MSVALQQVLELLTLTPVGEGRFRGNNQDLGLPQVFGGQLIAQALSAAMNVVTETRFLHSCHAYFLRAGSVQEPIYYETEMLRDGNSFSVVSVNAKQHNELIFRLTASFHLDEAGFEHQASMPNAEPPTALLSENEMIRQLAQHLPVPLREIFSQERPFEVRMQHANNPFHGAVLPPQQQLWVKTHGNAPAIRRLHQCLLAYFSDFHCIPTMLHPHQCGVFQQKARFATLDHSIRFHREFDFNQWLLFDLHSPNAYGARGLTSGSVFDQQGRLVATYQQEGLIRPL